MYSVKTFSNFLLLQMYESYFSRSYLHIYNSFDGNFLYLFLSFLFSFSGEK